MTDARVVRDSLHRGEYPLPNLAGGLQSVGRDISVDLENISGGRVG